jgi:hypothetical protein
MDWSIWGTKLASNLRSSAVCLAKLMISELRSAGQPQGRSGSTQAASENATQIGAEDGYLAGLRWKRPVVLAVHLDISLQHVGGSNAWEVGNPSRRTGRVASRESWYGEEMFDFFSGKKTKVPSGIELWPLVRGGGRGEGEATVVRAVRSLSSNFVFQPLDLT